MIKVFCSLLGSEERAKGDEDRAGWGQTRGSFAFTGGDTTQRCPFRPFPGIMQLFAHPWCQVFRLLINELLQTPFPVAIAKVAEF